MVVAVSGGIDSVVLLDRLVRTNQAVIVAHVNHGIRDDSDEDEVFVTTLAKQYGVPFVSTRLGLDPLASEDVARRARYAWLERVRQDFKAEYIVTAHHQDDVLETIVINLIRGTGWRGLSSLRSGGLRYRPLLETSKAEIVDYALKQGLAWREDSTNDSFRYLRNRVRATVIPRLSPRQRRELVDAYRAQVKLLAHIEDESRQLLSSYRDGEALLRHPLIMVDEQTGQELLSQWLGESLERARLHELLTFTKVAKKGAKWSLDGSRYVMADTDRLIVLSPRD